MLSNGINIKQCLLLVCLEIMYSGYISCNGIDGMCHVTIMIDQSDPIIALAKFISVGLMLFLHGLEGVPPDNWKASYNVFQRYQFQ